MKEWQILAVLGLVAFLLSAWPAFVYELPVAQTDGASYYVYAKTFIEEGPNAPNPRYNWWGSAERNINDYPPLSVFVFGLLTLVFNDIMLINGLYGAFFSALGVVFLYLFTKRLLGRIGALISSGLFLVSIRAYFTLFVGSYPAFTAYCLTWPALYYLYRALERGRWHWLAAVAATGLVSLTYPTQAVYVLFLQALLGVGYWMEGKISLQGIRGKTNRLRVQELLPLLGYGVASITVLAWVAITYLVTQGRSGWLREWVKGLVSANCTAYPCVWTYFTILDGPLLLVLALGGILYAINTNRWGLVGLGVGGSVIAASNYLFVHGDVLITQWIYRFYTTYFIVLALLAAYALLGLLASKAKQVGMVLVVLLFVIQAAKVGVLFTLVEPAATPEDLAAAMYLREHPGRVLYLNNLPEAGTFRAFKWVMVFAQQEDYALITDFKKEVDLPALGTYDYVYVGDYALQPVNGSVVFSQGKTRIVKP